MQVAKCRLTKSGDLLRIAFPSGVHEVTTVFVNSVRDAERIIVAWYGNTNFVDILDTRTNRVYKICTTYTNRLKALIFSILFDNGVKRNETTN